MRKPKQLSWKPRRRGNIYCAPACGNGCTLDEYRQARKNAKTLAASLGPKWIPRVHENLGWHYSALSPCGRLYVTPSFYASPGESATISYHAFLGEPFSYSGTWCGSGQTAKAAVRNVIFISKHELTRIKALLKNLPEV